MRTFSSQSCFLELLSRFFCIWLWFYTAVTLSLVYTRSKDKKRHKSNLSWKKNGLKFITECQNVDGKKKMGKLVAPCCSCSHKTVSIYFSSNITINNIVNNVAITMYRSAQQSKYNNTWPSYNNRLPSVKPKSHLLIEVLNITVPGILPGIHTSRLTLVYKHQGKIYVWSDSWYEAYIPSTSYLCLHGTPPEW